jgi:valyl-tRNA synthetase
VRFTLAQMAAQGRDVILSHDRFAAASAFANKIWNAARFIKMNLDGAPEPLPKVEIQKLGLAERWILSRLDSAIREVPSSIDAYEFNVAAMKLYQFIWHEFCDWYVEVSKDSLSAGGERQAQARWVLVNVFDRMLKLLHPFMPFVTEEIWQVIKPYLDEANLAGHLPIAAYPAPLEKNPLSDAEQIAMDHCLEATRAINSLRSLLGWHPGQRVKAIVKLTGADGAELEKWRDYATNRGKLESLETSAAAERRVVYTHLGWADVGVEAPENYDFDLARQKLQKQLDEVGKHAAQHEARLNDSRFMEKADPETKVEVAARFEGLQAQRTMLHEQLRQLEERA